MASEVQAKTATPEPELERDDDEVTEDEILEAVQRGADERPELGEHFAAVSEQLTRKWNELEVVEHAGYILFPESILRRTKKGPFEHVPIMVRVPRPPEMRKARKRAREQFKEDGLDPVADRDLFSQFENIIILAEAIRNVSSPYEPFEPNPLELERRYDTMSLQQVWQKLDAYNALLNPQPDRLTRDQFIALVAAIAEGRSIVPLDVISSDARHSFVITMAVLLRSSPFFKSFSVSSATSTAAAAPTASSSATVGTAAEEPR